MPPCTPGNTTTQNGEQVSYTVFYSVGGLYLAAGEASFSNKLETVNGSVVYHITGMGSSNASYDKVYRVRDKYESFIDTATMLPLRFIRNVREGNTKKYENISFNASAGTVVTDSGIFKVPACVQDVLSTIYYARNIDFSSSARGDKIPLKIFLENELHETYIRYLGKEKLTTRYGNFSAIKFRASLLSGTIFNSGENMTVWVSDDRNHIPLRIETAILIGRIKVDLNGAENLRYPLKGLKTKKSN